MTEKPTHKPHGIGWYAILIVVALVLYVASAGPAAYLMSHECIPECCLRGIETFYAPANVLAYFEWYRRYIVFFMWN